MATLLAAPVLTAADFDAHFASDGEVRDSLRCPHCAATASTVRVTGDSEHRVASVDCDTCAGTNVLSLSAEQAFRLWTLPHGRTYVHVAADVL